MAWEGDKKRRRHELRRGRSKGEGKDVDLVARQTKRVGERQKFTPY